MGTTYILNSLSIVAREHAGVYLEPLRNVFKKIYPQDV